MAIGLWLWGRGFVRVGWRAGSRGLRGWGPEALWGLKPGEGN